MVVEPGADKFARIAKRLASTPDRTDLGQLLEKTGAALEIGDPGPRLQALVDALGTERVVIPVPVEEHPRFRQGEHSPQDLHEDSEIPLATEGEGADREVLVFSSADELKAWDTAARPMTMGSQKMAITAIASGVPRVRMDPAGINLRIPRSAVEALAGGARWVAPWNDEGLAQTLTEDARALSKKWATFADARVLYRPDGLRVEVRVSPKGDGENVQALFAAMLQELAQNPRLAGAAEKVEFVPRLVPHA